MTKAFRYEQAKKSFPWVKDVPRAPVQVIGIADVLGAVGLILPAAIGFYGWLTPMAAVALGLHMLLAALRTFIVRIEVEDHWGRTIHGFSSLEANYEVSPWGTNVAT